MGGAVAGLLAYVAGTRRSSAAETFEVVHTDQQWKSLLPASSYQVLRHEGTEAPFSSPLDHLFKKGVYDCAGCDLPLFRSETKFDSGTGDIGEQTGDRAAHQQCPAFDHDDL